jgi:tRNA 2-selenouridine synthase
MFENKLALELNKITTDYPNNSIWIEDESQRIGAVSIPQSFWEKMRKSLVYFIDIPFERRLTYIIETYGKLDQKELAEAIIRIQKRLGGLETKTAIDYLESNDLESCFSILLKYYDKLYLKSLHSRAVGCNNQLEIKKTAEEEEKYKKNIKSQIVDAELNSQLLIDAFYGRN